MTFGTRDGIFGEETVLEPEIVEVSLPYSPDGAKRCPVQPGYIASSEQTSSSSAFVGGRPIVCSADGSYRSCLEFQADKNQWTVLQTLVPSVDGLWTEGVKLNETNWWVGAASASSRLYLDGEGFVDSVEMPGGLKRTGYRAVRISDYQLMLTGGQVESTDPDVFGYVDTGEVWIYDFYLGAWSQEQSLPSGSRSRHVAGIYQGITGSRYVVVAGGMDENFNALNSTEIFNLRRRKWEEGPALPVSLTEATSVGLGWSFVVLGGFDHEADELNESVFEFDPFSYELRWNEREEKIRVPRKGLSATLIPTDYCQTIQGS